jgi:N-acylneuraminate cytidylyltransferase/CMP-N,N'-diacetyllegionaminic acid synthase
LATDSAPAIDTFIYTIKRLREDFGQDHRECVVLQPTSPLRYAHDIDSAITLFYEKQADSVISVVELTHPPAWAKKIDARGILRDYFDAPIGNQNRQAFEKAFIPNGAIYVFKSTVLMEKHSYYSDKTYAYVMPRERSIDIDDQWDFEFAEFIMTKLCKS